MRSHAKASSAGSTMRRGKGLGRIVRGAFAGRDASSDANGSGAPSYRGYVSLLSLVALAFIGLALTVSSAFASKEVVDYIGGDAQSGSEGGEFWNPGDSAVNTTGAGGVPAGTIYVADELNDRVQRFSPSGAFVSAWGANVQTPAVNEVQTLTVQAGGGTYTLGFDGGTTAPIPYDASASAVQSALWALPTLGSFNVNVSGSGAPFTLTFANNLAATNVAQIFVDDANLSGSASTGHPTQGFGAYEVCTVAANCSAGVGTGTANFNDAAKNGALSSPQSVAVDGDTGNVYVSDRGNNRVNEYAADGTFIRSFGFGVDASTAGSGYEVCPAGDRCTMGLAGSGVGQIGEAGFFAITLGIAVSPPDGNAATGTVFLADTSNRRVNTYDLDGANPSSFGSSVQFGENQPRKVAVDSRGIVYASDSGSGGEIERYDTEDANGGGVGFLAPIASPPLLTGFAESATSGLAVDPDSDGGGADEDVLYVLRSSSVTFKSVVQQFGPVNDPGLTAAPTAVDDTHGMGADFASSARGLALDEASGRLFVSGTAATSSANRVYILDDAPAPGSSIDPVTSFDSHSATFSGSVDPNGVQSGYHFEYVDDAEFLANGFTNAQRYPLIDVGVGKGEAPVSVQQEVPHHLIAGTTYHVRLVAKHSFGTGQTPSSAVTFTTQSSPPSFGTAATDVDADSTILRAAINPENQAVTNYHFEWGTTENVYGSSTPAETLPSGTAPVAVEEELASLTPGQTYHYRLVATNATGTTTGPDQTFTTMAGAPQLPERGYEIASEYPSGGIPVIAVLDAFNPSEDGNLLGIRPTSRFRNTTLPTLPDHIRSSGLGGPPSYLFSRGSDSWQHRTDVGVGGEGFSANAEAFVTVTETDGPGSDNFEVDPRLDPDDRNRRLDVYQWRPDGKLTWISRDPRIPVGTPQTAANGEVYLGDNNGPFTMSADGRTVVVRSSRQLLDADTTSGSVFRLYKWHDGELSFIGKRPDGSVPAGGSRLGDSNELTIARYAVSRDGRRVVFSARRDDGGTGDAIYVQTDSEPTVEATKEEGVPPLPADQPYGVTYRGASADGSRVFFTSSSRLTPDSGGGATFSGAVDLYVYDVEADELRDLTPRLDGLDDPTVSPATADQARVLGVADNSTDGKRVYFVADAQYPTAPNPEGELPSAGGPNLYLAELDQIDDPIKLSFVATLGSGQSDTAAWSSRWFEETTGIGYQNRGKTSYASPDASVLGFASTVNLTGQPLGGTEQLFAYDVDRGALECPSCPSDGSLPANTVNFYNPGAEELRSQWQGAESVKRWVSSDGTVFFDTETALLPGDENIVSDVYEFRDGKLGLITSGTATAGSLFGNASVDGSSAFFSTQQALVPQDKEPGVTKAYVARVGGGFPYVPPPTPCDFNAGACEGNPSAAPNSTGAGTAAFEGPGDPEPVVQRRCPKGKRKVRAKGKTRCVKRHKRTAKNDRRASR